MECNDPIFRLKIRSLMYAKHDCYLKYFISNTMDLNIYSKIFKNNIVENQ